MKPGDMVEWTYKATGSQVVPTERLWSSTMQRYVPIGGRNNLLVGLSGKVVTWLSPKGLFHARVDDSGGVTPKADEADGCSTRVWMTGDRERTGRSVTRLFHAW